MSSPLCPSRVLETSIYASDLDAARRFYTEVLGLTVLVEQPGRHVFFRVGNTMFLVFNPDASSDVHPPVNGDVLVPRHGAQGPGHMAFAVPEAALPEWRERLQRAGVCVEAEFEWPSGTHSLYFRDPAGNSIELATAEMWGLSE